MLTFEIHLWSAVTFIIPVISLLRFTAMGRTLGRDRFRCRGCQRVFLLTYTYETRKPGVMYMAFWVKGAIKGMIEDKVSCSWAQKHHPH